MWHLTPASGIFLDESYCAGTLGDELNSCSLRDTRTCQGCRPPTFQTAGLHLLPAAVPEFADRKHQHAFKRQTLCLRDPSESCPNLSLAVYPIPLKDVPLFSHSAVHFSLWPLHKKPNKHGSVSILAHRKRTAIHLSSLAFDFV